MCQVASPVHTKVCAPLCYCLVWGWMSFPFPPASPASFRGCVWPPASMLVRAPSSAPATFCSCALLHSPYFLNKTFQISHMTLAAGLVRAKPCCWGHSRPLQRRQDLAVAGEDPICTAERMKSEAIAKGVKLITWQDKVVRYLAVKFSTS